MYACMHACMYVCNHGGTKVNQKGKGRFVPSHYLYLLNLTFVFPPFVYFVLAFFAHGLPFSFFFLAFTVVLPFTFSPTCCLCLFTLLKPLFHLYRL